jgi:hypothetical protein
MQTTVRLALALLIAELTMISLPGAATAQASAQGAAVPDTTIAAPGSPHALSQELAAVLAEETVRLRELEARFAAAADASAALVAEREIAALKMGTEERLMEAQARCARADGRLEDAAKIEAAIAEMRASRSVPAPIGPREPRTPPRPDGQPADGGQR